MHNDEVKCNLVESWNIPPSYDARFPYKLQVYEWSNGAIDIEVRDFNGSIKKISIDPMNRIPNST